MLSNRKAVLYARVSSKEQEQEGFSIPAQLKLLKECAAKQAIAEGLKKLYPYPFEFQKVLK